VTKSRNILRPRKRWTDSELEILRARYPHEQTSIVSAALGRDTHGVYRKANQLGILKTEAYLESPAAGRTRPSNGSHPNSVKHRFQKGQTSHNKGLRRPGWHRGRMKETQFRKGQLSGQAAYNYVPIGTLRVNADGYLDKKVTDDASIVSARRWVGVHRLVWEEAHGPIPDGYVVVFQPGRRTIDPNLITLDALELVSRVELMRRNTVHNLPKELAELVQLRGALMRKINRRTRESEEQDQRSAESPLCGAGSSGGSGQADGHRASEGDCGRRPGGDQQREGGSRDGEGGRQTPGVRFHAAGSRREGARTSSGAELTISVGFSQFAPKELEQLERLDGIHEGDGADEPDLEFVDVGGHAPIFEQGGAVEQSPIFTGEE
jgi:hypothetical protein